MTLEVQFARWEYTQAGEVLTATDITPPLQLVRYEPMAPETDKQTVTDSLEVVAARDHDWWLREVNGTLARARYWAREAHFRRDLRTVIRVRDNRRHFGETWFESPLYDGRVEFLSGSGKHWRVNIERGPYWRGAETRLHVQNTGGAGLGTWADRATIYNHDDDMPGHNNWVLVEPPGGDVPTPIRLLVRNTYNTTRPSRLRQVRVGWYNQPQQLALDVTQATSGATLLPEDADYSFNRQGSGTAFQWEVNNSAFQDFTGMFKVFANGDLSDGDWQISVGYALTRMQHAPEGYVPGAQGWTDLGNLVLPAGRYVHPERYPLKVWLEGTETGTLDFLLFMPVNQDSFIRELTFRGYNAQVGTCIEDDATRDEVAYQFNAQRVPVIDVLGYPLMAQPLAMLPQALPANYGIPNAQMLSFTLESDSRSAAALRTAEVEVFAQPWYAVLP